MQVESIKNFEPLLTLKCQGQHVYLGLSEAKTQMWLNTAIERYLGCLHANAVKIYIGDTAGSQSHFLLPDKHKNLNNSLTIN